MNKQLLTFALLCSSFTLSAAEAAALEKTLHLYPPGPSLTPQSKVEIEWNKIFVPEQLYMIVAQDLWETIQSFLTTKAIGVPFIHGAHSSKSGFFSWDEIRLRNLQTTTQYDPFGADKWCVKLLHWRQAFILLKRYEKKHKKPHLILKVGTKELVGLFERGHLEENFFGERVPRDELAFYFYKDRFVTNALPLRAVTALPGGEDEWVCVSTEE